MLQSRRQFLIGAGAVLSPPFRGGVAMLLADAALLAELTPWERELVQRVMAHYPALTLAKAIEMLKAFGV
jgi:hypothetical protein